MLCIKLVSLWTQWTFNIKPSDSDGELQIVTQSAPYGRVKKQTVILPLDLETDGYVKSSCSKTDDNVDTCEEQSRRRRQWRHDLSSLRRAPPRGTRGGVEGLESEDCVFVSEQSDLWTTIIFNFNIVVRNETLTVAVGGLPSGRGGAGLW